MTDRMLTIDQAATKMLATPENVRRMIWSGRLEAKETSPGYYAIPERAIDRLIERGEYVPGITQPSE